MGGISNALEIGKNALLNTQLALETVSHNIANADNKAYARQKVTMVTNPAYRAFGGWVGQGASVNRITQQRDQFIERRLMDAISQASDYDVRSEQLSAVASYLSDDGESGLSQVLGEFWDAWETLSQNPDGLAQKTAVKEAVNNLAFTIRDTYNNLVDQSKGLEETIENDVSKADSLLAEIAQYNAEIVKAEAAAPGQGLANDLRDLRYEALTSLAELLPVKYTEEENGSLTIKLTDDDTTLTLVSGDVAGHIQYNEDGDHLVTYEDTQGNTYSPATDPSGQNILSGGKIAGELAVYRSIGVPQDDEYSAATSGSYLDRLNTFASTLITEVNAEHGTNVFADTAAGFSPAGSIAAIDGFEPDGTQGLAITELQDEEFAALSGGSTFVGYLSDIQQSIGVEQQSAVTQADFHDALRQSLEASQQAVSGVSMDEEMVDLIKYQHAYQAAAKVIEQSAAMLNTVIAMVR